MAVALGLSLRTTFRGEASVAGLVTGFAAVIVVLVVFYAGFYPEAVRFSNGCFSAAHLSHLSAVYFAVGTLTTAGTGALSAKSDLCRTLVTSQTVLGSVLVFVGLAGLVTRLRRGG
jgi:Ion channel